MQFLAGIGSADAFLHGAGAAGGGEPFEVAGQIEHVGLERGCAEGGAGVGGEDGGLARRKVPVGHSAPANAS